MYLGRGRLRWYRVRGGVRGRRARMKRRDDSLKGVLEAGDLNMVDLRIVCHFM